MQQFRLFILLVFSVLCQQIQAQSTEDVVFLKNGSILRGTIKEHLPGKYVSIEIVGQNLIVIPDSATSKIEANRLITIGCSSKKNSGFGMTAKANFYGGSKNSAGFTFVTDYCFPFRFSVGAGLGVEWFNRQQIPFMAELKYDFLKTSFTPYVYATAGYAVPLSHKPDNENAWNYQITEYFGGVLAGAGGGVKFNFANRNALLIHFGYRYQKIKTVVTNNYWNGGGDIVTNFDLFNRLTFGVGFAFN